MEWSLGSVDWSLVLTVFFGAVSGYIASRILGGEGFGFFGNIVVGVIGGFIGSWLVKVAKVPLMSRRINLGNSNSSELMVVKVRGMKMARR